MSWPARPEAVTVARCSLQKGADKQFPVAGICRQSDAVVTAHPRQQHIPVRRRSAAVTAIFARMRGFADHQQLVRECGDASGAAACSCTAQPRSATSTRSSSIRGNVIPRHCTGWLVGGGRCGGGALVHRAQRHQLRPQRQREAPRHPHHAGAGGHAAVTEIGAGSTRTGGPRRSTRATCRGTTYYIRRNSGDAGPRPTSGARATKAKPTR